MKRAVQLGVLCISLTLCGSLMLSKAADEQPVSAVAATPNLQRLLDVVGRSTKKRFLVAGISQDISWSGIDDRAVSYPLLLTILMDNGLDAVETDGIVHIVRLANIRQYPTPVITAKDLAQGGIPDDEVVSMVLHVQYAEAVRLVPVLRPLMPQWSQLSAVPDENSFIMTDRFANVRRVAKVISLLDQAAAAASAVKK